MTDLVYPPCKYCGNNHGMGVKNTDTGEIKPIDICAHCLFYANIDPLTDQVVLTK
jgi:hypothetical protein